MSGSDPTPTHTVINGSLYFFSTTNSTLIPAAQYYKLMASGGPYAHPTATDLVPPSSLPASPAQTTPSNANSVTEGQTSAPLTVGQTAAQTHAPGSPGGNAYTPAQPTQPNQGPNSVNNPTEQAPNTPGISNAAPGGSSSDSGTDVPSEGNSNPQSGGQNVQSGPPLDQAGSSSELAAALPLITGDLTYAPVGGSPNPQQGGPLPNPAQLQNPVPTSIGVVNGETIYHQGSSLIIGSQTIAQDAEPTVIGGTPIAFGPSAVVVGANTISVSPAGAEFTPQPVYSVGGVAITQGEAPITISGVEYSLGPSYIMAGNNKIPLPTISPSNPVLTIAGQTITANPTGFSIAGTTITPNAPALAYSGTVISLNPTGVIVGASTFLFPSSSSTPPSSVLTIGSQTLTAIPGGGFEINHSTLLPGFPALTVSGNTYSLNSASSLIVDGASTIPLATAAAGPTNSNNAALTAAGQTFTPLGTTAVIINGTTLSLSSPAITEADGEIISLASDGLVIGSSTYAFPTPASAPATTTSNVTPIRQAAVTSTGTLMGPTAGSGSGPVATTAATAGSKKKSGAVSAVSADGVLALTLGGAAVFMGLGMGGW